MMPDQIKLPGVGEVNKKYLIAGGGVLLVILAVVMYRKNKAASAAAAAAASGNASTPIDPETNYPYGSPEDQAALAALSAASGTGGNFGGGSATTPTVPAGTGLTTNAQWEQDAVNFLTQTIQLPAANVSSALGAYLAGQDLDPGQMDIVHQAIAAEGVPPVAAADGYPPNLRETAVTPPAPGPGGTPGTPKVGAAFEGPWMVQRGQTKQSIAGHFGLTTTQLDQANPGATYAPGSGLKIPWLIQAGQTMQFIAAAFEIPVSQIAPYVPVY